MKYVELTISTTSEAQELVSDLMWEYTDYGVAICDVKDVIELIENRRSTFDYIEDGIMKSFTSGTLVKAYFDVDLAAKIIPQIESRLHEMKKNAQGYIDFGSLEAVKREVDGDDWIEVWRKHYRPIDLGKILVCPEWIDAQPKDGQKIVRIESNMAFGTGEHETTSMCIEFLSEYVKEGIIAVDVGTGSGILGIACANLGAGKVYMVDNDPVAVETAKRNCALNNVNDVCVVDEGNLLDDKDVYADLIVANITADVLLILVKTIDNHIKKGGRIILSGILNDRVNDVISGYEKHDFKVDKSRTKGEWTALSMVKQ